LKTAAKPQYNVATMANYLAVDLGAESGRVMRGSLAGTGTELRLELEEIRRFPNQPVELPSGLYWDAFRLFHEIQEGLTTAGRERHLPVAGIGVDTWGVDFGLLAPDGGLIECPHHYRDPRTNGVPERLFQIVPRREVFTRTGIQIMPLNTLYQLYALRLADSPALPAASRLLFMPDLLNYWLTGVERGEVTIASTSQFYDTRARRFDTELLDRLEIPTRLLPDLIEPAQPIGPLLPHLAANSGLGAVPVWAVGAHDTASAVAAVPSAPRDTGWCYISSGTWSLVGLETECPVIDERSYNLNFTNEAGVGGRTRLLKNVPGLWLLQECRRAWAAEGERLTYEELAGMAEACGPARAIIDPDDFLQPGDMPARIAAWCGSHGLDAPRTKGEFCRTVLESLAHRYRDVIEGLESLTGRAIETVHIVGGGSRNALLNRLTASITGRKVIAGPAEATAAGNLLVQAIGAGEVRDLAEAREIVRRSFEICEY
jgi:rhamnulokinase